MSNPDPNPEPDPECIPVPAVPIPQHCSVADCNCALLGGHGGDARAVHLPQRSHHH